MYVTTKIERHRQSNYSFGLVMCCFRDFLKVKGKILKALSCTDAKIIRLKIDIAVMRCSAKFFAVLRCSKLIKGGHTSGPIAVIINQQFSFLF